VKDSKAPAAVKTQFDALAKEFASLRPKFGVGAPAGGGGGRGGFGGGGAGGGRGAGGGGAAGGGAAASDAPAQEGAGAAQAAVAAAPADNLVARAGTVKGQIMAFNELPSDTLTKSYTDVKTALPKAIADANAFLARAMTMSQTLKKYDVTMTVPAPVK
jgi:hypothetical protein